MPSRQRFERALRELDHERWARFEQLASTFLAGDFDDLRTMASPSGDLGRDAQLFVTGEPTTLVQYSVAQDWRSKIAATVRRVKQNFPDISMLIYVTNQQIGADADDVVQKARREQGIALDIRDRSWFLDRMHRNRAREVAAEELAREVVDPLLPDDGLIERRPSPLSDIDMRAAVVHLELQWANDERDKGLTRTSYEALVRSVLRDTDSDHRMSRTEVREAVRSLLPTHDAETGEVIDRHTDKALNKLASKKGGSRLIRHWQQADEFCLTYDERLRLNEHLIEADNQEHDLQDELRELVVDYTDSADGEALPDDVVGQLLVRGRRVLERFLFGRGEAFAVAVRTGQFEDLDFQDLTDLVIKDFTEEPYEDYNRAREVVETVVRDIIVQPGAATQRYLRSLVDAYTLLAFLQETPDVQRAVREMFSYGEIWLDTNVLLPLIAERLLEEDARQYTSLIKAAREAGLELYITDGVLEELERQLNRALTFVRSEEWRGDIPFFFAVYASLGEPREAFASWIEEFMGPERPEDDLAEFLNEEFGIKVRSLREDAESIDDELRFAVQTVWTEIHEQRANRRGYARNTAEVLAKHDAESYLGVIARRTGNRDSPFGYSSWWLTLDGVAFRFEQWLQPRLVGRVLKSPVMSPDFLTSYLAFGPLRQNISKERELALPIALGRGMTEFTAPEVIAEAEQVRERFAGLPQRRLRRHIRDAMDRAKRRMGELADAGQPGV